MARKEAKRFKALYFDLRIKDLEEYYSKTRRFLYFGVC